MDLFAEDTDNRTVVEIQKVDYDYTYDRFTHYFTGNLSDVQRSSKTYSYEKDIYIIVVVTSTYRMTDKNGVLIKDDVLITDVNPRTLNGEMRDMYNHKLVILNSTHTTKDTPPAILDWLDLIKESMKNPENPHINTAKPAIARAAQLAQTDNIDPEEIADAKIEEMRKETLARVELDAKRQIKEAKDKAHEEIEEAKKEIEEAKKEAEETKKTAEETKKASIITLLKMGKLSIADIANVFDVTSDDVKQIQAEMD
jgi:hypothetical protein